MTEEVYAMYNFCGSSTKDDNRKFVSAGNVAICEHCVESCRDVIGHHRMLEEETNGAANLNRKEEG